MKKAYIFPGQGAQFEGMGKAAYDNSPIAKALFDEANSILGWSITDIMFSGSKEDLTETKVTQPAVFLESLTRAMAAGADFKPQGVAGHSLGEFTALVAAGALPFADGLILVSKRAFAMQNACEMAESTMAAVLGLDDEVVEKICAAHPDMQVVAANYNTPGQLVISGSTAGIEAITPFLNDAGARRVVPLAVGGGFHSPFMQPAQDELAAAIENAPFSAPICPIYQNVHAKAVIDPEEIRANLIAQLTAPVRWTQTVQNMFADGYSTFIEVGGGGPVLRGMIRRIERAATLEEL